jgi:NADH dehydrogenase
MSIAHNLKALVADKPLSKTDVHIRGTLMKLGLEAGAANIYNQAEVDGTAAHLIRQGTYMSLLPNPVHNLQAGLKWFNEGVLKRYLEPAEPETIARWTAGAVVTAVVARKVVHSLGSSDDE